MNTLKTSIIQIVTIVAVAWTTSFGAAFAADVQKMTTDELKNRLTDPDIVVIDVRAGRDWTGSEVKIQGAKRADPDDVGSWAEDYGKDRTLVLYCA